MLCGGIRIAALAFNTFLTDYQLKKDVKPWSLTRAFIFSI